MHISKCKIFSAHNTNLQISNLISKKNKNLDWFPRMIAGSLLKYQSEDDENQINNLKRRLEYTNNLVENLTKQIDEFKEIVNINFLFNYN